MGLIQNSLSAASTAVQNSYGIYGYLGTNFIDETGKPSFEVVSYRENSEKRYESKFLFYQILPFSADSTAQNFCRVYQIALNILGYIPAVSVISGSVRIGVATVILGVIGIIRLSNGPIPPKDESIMLHYVAYQVSQIFRGAMEAFVPFGKVANLALDLGLAGYQARLSDISRSTL